MKYSPQTTFLLVVCVLFVGCGGRNAPIRGPDVKPTQAQINKTKEYYQRQLEKIENQDLKSARIKITQKRAGGFNVFASVEKVDMAEKLIGEVFNDMILEKFESIDESGKKITIEEKFEQIKRLLKEGMKLLDSAPRFGEKPKPEKGVFTDLTLSSDQAEVYQIMGPPDQKISFPSSDLRLHILSPTDLIFQSKCFDSQSSEFIITSPPSVEVWVYDGRRTGSSESWAIVFVSDFNGLSQLSLNQNLNEQTRDQVLGSYCSAPNDMAPFVKVSTIDILRRSYPTGSDEVLRYLFTREGMPFPLGFDTIFENAKSGAALPSLSFINLVFNTRLFPLNIEQDKRFKEIYEILSSSEPDFAEFFLNLEKAERSITGLEINQELEKFKEKNLRDPTENEKKTVILSVEQRHLKELKKIRENIFKKTTRQGRKILELFWQIAAWQKTLDPKNSDINALAKEINGPSRDKIISLCKDFSSALLSLRKEFEATGGQLRNYGESKPPEIIFSDKDLITIFFLVEGVRYLPQTLENGTVAEQPDLVLKIQVRYKISDEILEQLGLDPNDYLVEHEVSIEQANRFFKELKDSQRLTSFGIYFPFRLGPGEYKVRFELIDKNRGNMTAEYFVDWNIFPKDSSAK